MRTTLKINVDGHIVSYEDSLKNTQPIIFIHGFPFDKSTWHPQFDFLKETHRVIIYDLPGFGNSEPMPQEASIPAFADHLIKFMDALKMDKAVVCGLSMGGYILLNALERSKERISAIILSDTQCLADSKENAQKRFETAAQIEKEGLEDFAEGFLKKAFSKETQEKNKKLVEQTKHVILSNSQETITSALKALAARTETCSRLKTINLPALILCGEEDELTPVTQSEFLFSNLPQAELHILKKAGHLSNLEQADEFNDRLHNFISDIII